MMLSFDGIVEFVAVADRHSFSSAARQLGVSTSHVSRQVTRLESRLGAALFARTTRKVSLTTVGQAYYKHCNELVQGLEYADDELKADQSSLTGTVRISAAGAFAENHVAKALVEFGLKHPRLSIEIDFNSRIVDFTEDRIDFAIRYGKLKDSGLVARKLVDRSMVMAASPDYLKKHGTPTTLNDLSDHQCIISNSEIWNLSSSGEEVKKRVSGRWRSNNATAVVNACCSGIGIAYMPKSSYLSALDKGVLQPILEPYWGKGTSSWIVYQNKRFVPARVRMAIEYLIDYFKDWAE